MKGDKVIETIRIPSFNDPDRTYEVSFWDDGRGTCTCESYRYSGTRTECKHIVHARGLGYPKHPQAVEFVVTIVFGDGKLNYAAEVVAACIRNGIQVTSEWREVC